MFKKVIFSTLLGKCLTQAINITTPSTLTDGQIGGLVIGILALVILFILIIGCLCIIEIKTFCFLNCLAIYSVFQKKIKTSTLKKYDLFISFDKTKEKWIHEKLVNFLKKENITLNYCFHYEREDDEAVYSENIKLKLNSSSHVLLILTDVYLQTEWNNLEFRNHVRSLLINKQIRLTCIQMNDVTDEEVEEYIRSEIQQKKLNSFEIGEFYFWQKLKYYLIKDKSQKKSRKFKSNSNLLQRPFSGQSFSTVIQNNQSTLSSSILEFPVFSSIADHPTIYLYKTNTNNIDSKLENYQQQHTQIDNQVHSEFNRFDDSYRQSLKQTKKSQFIIQHGEKNINEMISTYNRPPEPDRVQKEMGKINFSSNFEPERDAIFEKYNTSVKKSIGMFTVSAPDGFNDEAISLDSKNFVNHFQV
jgi:hypothetical protein